MPNVRKRLSARVLKRGKNRIWLNPEKMADIDKSLTAWDIRKHIKKGDIKLLPEKIRTPGTTIKRKKGPGSRKGKKYAILPSKRRWVSAIRAQRGMLRELKDLHQLDKPGYRKLYKLAKGGMFRSKAHLKLHMEENKMLKK